MALDSDIGLDAVASIEKGRIDNAPGVYVHLRRTNTVQECHRIVALHHEFGKGGLVNDRGPVAAGLCFFADLLPPGGDAKGKRQMGGVAAEMFNSFPAAA